MPDRRRALVSIASVVFAVSGLAVAGFVAVDTIRTVVSLHSALPWFDDWNTVDLFRDWSLGTASAFAVLFSQFGEHRLLVPRLVFFADDLFFGGQGWLTLGAILLVQAAHAALFATVLSAAPTRGAGRWAVAGLVVALMFSLRQEPNFASSFQLQFVGVFASATLAFVLFGRVAAGDVAGLPVEAALAASLLAATVSTFCMANGLICGPVLVALALVARLRTRIVAIVGAASAALALLYLQGYHAAADHTPLADAIRRPAALALYAATYLGNLAGRENATGAAALGLLGAAATAVAAVLVARRSVDSRAGLALLGVMLFCGATALVTATGRLNAGVGQALEERYVTGSVTFWSAQLCFWWIAAPARLPRLALAAVGIWLAVVLVGAQGIAKPALYQQKFAEDDAGDLLLLDLDDPAVVLRTAWDDTTVRRDRPFLSDARISIFGAPEATPVGRALSALGEVAPPETCSGMIAAARLDPGLGPNGVSDCLGCQG